MRCRKPHDHKRRTARKVHKTVHRGADTTASALHMARRRTAHAPHIVLRKSVAPAASVRAGTHHRQLPADQRHASHRRVVRVFQTQQLPHRHIHRRSEGVSRRIPAHTHRRSVVRQGDARHTAAQQARGGMERHGCGERLQRGLSARVLPLLQGHRRTLHPVRAHHRTASSPL